MDIKFFVRAAFPFGTALTVGLFSGAEFINTAMAASTQLNKLLYNKTYRVTSIERYLLLSHQATMRRTMLHGRSSTILSS